MLNTAREWFYMLNTAREWLYMLNTAREWLYMPRYSPCVVAHGRT